jgi:hypothetical protein
MRPEMRMKKRCGYFVVLVIGRLGFNGDGTRTQVIEKTIEPLRASFAVVEAFIAEPLTHQSAHAKTDQRIRQPAAFAATD